MILDMKEGTLGFKTEDEDYGVAMKGLQYISEKLYVTGALSCPGDTLQMKYLGSSGKCAAIRDQLDHVEERPDTNKGHSESETRDYI